MSEDEKDNLDEDSGKDFVVLGPTTATGQMALRHREDNTMELAELRPADNGQALPEGTELVKLSGEGPKYQVETLYDNRKGPAKVASKKYRDGWDAIWQKKNPPRDLN